ncbi:MAG TPA: minor capsid protein [Flavobacteriaceae bacterium]|nr:minor capsid protein [Flavobacteriaceae bacterium]
MAKLWTDNIREIWRNKGFDGTPNNPIVTETAKHLIKPINDVFGQAIDYDSPDYILRETLKKNVWDFSVAKNNQDNIRLNNLLLDDQGKLRSWSDFKHEAQKVVGTSNRYLRTEYNTVVAGAQMSRLWQDIQKDKHLFPFVQFDVVEDKRTSDICEPLSDVIMSVDDPVLINYFPPNHFNCRTTVRRLHSGVPTENYNLPDIPKAFKNNVAVTGEIFTKENAYIANTPEIVHKNFHKRRKEEEVAKLTKWRKENIKEGGEIINDFYLSRRAVREIERHFTDIYYKHIVKDIKSILRESTFIESKPLDKNAFNYAKKASRGVVKYEYYKFTWKQETFRLNVEVFTDGRRQPYAINLIKKGT